MLQWMSLTAFIFTAARVALVWGAFRTAGSIAGKYLKPRRLFPLLPGEILGMLLLGLLMIVFSLAGVMNRTVVPLTVAILGLPGLFTVLMSLVKGVVEKKRSPWQTVFSVILVCIALMGLMYASMPNLKFDDPLITYAVQPDRWLNAGRIFWLEETAFSGFPLLYEITAVMPASLSTDRIDQLSVLQVFQYSLLLVAVFRGMKLLRLKSDLKAPTASIILLCTMLLYWCTLAKTDTMAILFCTLALGSAVRERSLSLAKPYSSWFFMGAALATKQTAILVLVPFLLYSTRVFARSSWRVRAVSLLMLILLPGAFALRTMMKTGSPTYPKQQLSFMVSDEWRLLPYPEQLSTINDRNSALHRHYSPLKHIGIFLTSMEGILLLFLGGLGHALLRKGKRLGEFIPLLVYLPLAMLILWPPWWGAKYSILIYPFAGILGASALPQGRSSKYALATIALVSFVVPGFIISARMVIPFSYRWDTVRAISGGNWRESSLWEHPTEPTPESMASMWLNSYAGEPCQVLYLHEEKRYFSNHTIYVGWRHPETQYLYIENSLEEECAILDGLGIDYVCFYRSDPEPLDLENRLAILDHIGQNDVLEPVFVISGYQIARYRSPL